MIQYMQLSSSLLRRLTGTVSTLCTNSSFPGRCVSCVNSRLINNLWLLTTLSLMMGPQYAGFQPITVAAVLGTVALSWGYNGWHMVFITHPHLVPMLRMSTAVPLLSLCVFTACYRENFTLIQWEKLFSPCKTKVRLLPTGRTVPKFTTVPTTATKLNYARDVFSRVPLWVSGDSPQTTSIAPCSNYTNVHPVPLTAPYLGLFTSGQPITDYTDNTHSWIHLFGILLWYFNPWNWDHYIPLKPINHRHSATFQKEWRPQRSSYLHWLNIK